MAKKKPSARSAKPKAKPAAKPAAKRATAAGAPRKPSTRTAPTAPKAKQRQTAKPATAAKAAKAQRGPQTSAGPDASLLGDLVGWARAAGADAADAIFVHGASLAVSQRLGKREKLERSEGHDLGLRVLIGRRQAFVSSTDFDLRTLRDVAARAVAMARAVPEDPTCGLAPRNLLAKSWPDLDLDDGSEPSAEALGEQVRRAEEAALAVAGVTNSEGADAGWSRTRVLMVASNGFAGEYARAGYSLSCSMLAGKGTGMERDYEWSAAVHAADLMSPEEVGRRAAENAVRRLDPRKTKSARVPVVFDRRVAGSLLGHLAGAINGRAIARKTSFLLDRMGKPVFGRGIEIVDDPHRRRGLGSRPFDGEGLPTRQISVIRDGRLKTWLLDLAAARQLKLAPTGHAARGVSGPPSPSTSNLHMMPGKRPVAALIGDIKSGLYITSLIGFGVNAVTGDYSRGASGMWIENGRLAYPVSGLTVAGNLKDMFRELTPADDLEFKSSTNAPTVRIEGMTVAGE